jgi:hypothetical protein
MGEPLARTMRRQSHWMRRDGMLLGDGEVVAMAVKEMHHPVVWRTFAKGHVWPSEEGGVATQMASQEISLKTTTGVELTEGRH